MTDLEAAPIEQMVKQMTKEQRWRAKNPEKRREQKKRYYAAHKDKWVARRAREKEAKQEQPADLP